MTIMLKISVRVRVNDIEKCTREKQHGCLEEKVWVRPPTHLGKREERERERKTVTEISREVEREIEMARDSDRIRL